SEPDVVAALTEVGLTPVIKHRHNPSGGGPLTQSVPPGTPVALGAPIEVVFPVSLSAPVFTSPVGRDSYFPRLAETPPELTFLSEGRNDTFTAQVDLSWSQAETFVTSWAVTIFAYVCFFNGFGGYTDGEFIVVDETVTTTSFSTTRVIVANSIFTFGVYNCQ